jgi:hypothetical protein
VVCTVAHVLHSGCAWRMESVAHVKCLRHEATPVQSRFLSRILVIPIQTGRRISAAASTVHGPRSKSLAPLAPRSRSLSFPRSFVSRAGQLHLQLILCITVYPSSRNKAFANMNHTIDNDEPPSPPPFFRVSGHFTVFNPSRLMVLAAAASKYPSLATTDNTLASSVPDLGEENVSGWPSLDNSFRRIDSRDASSDMSTQDTKMPVAKKIKVEMPPLSPITLSTSPDRFLPIILAPVSPKNRVSSRHHVRWSPEEDDLLRTAVGFEAGPPHNWKHIAYTYFRNTRNGLACKGRWTKVRSHCAESVRVTTTFD